MSQTSHTPPASPSFLSFAGRIDRLNAAIGRAAAWACLFVVMVQFAVVVLRYVFGHGSIWLSESIVYGHAAMFMLASAWTLAARRTRAGGRVLRRRVAAHQGAGRSLRRAAAAAAVHGGAGLVRLPYVARSWAILEMSRETSGIPAVFLLKTLIPVFALLMALQGVSQAIKAWRASRCADRA